MHHVSIVSLCLVSITAISSAQAAGDAAAGAPADPSSAATPGAVATAPAPISAPEPGATLRTGFSLSLGQEFGSGPSMGLSGQLYGVDWRIGAKINDALAVYLDTHLSFGTAKIGAASGVTSDFASAVIAEYTLPVRLFFGGGAGYGVLNNPSGPLVQLRAGYYPFAHSSPDKARRLNVALDTRFYFADASTVGRVTQVSLSIGYDRF